MRKLVCWIVALAFLSAGYVAQATIYDVAADFSKTNNPNGVWSYGWSSTLTSDLNLLYDNSKMGELAGTPINIDAWCDWEQFSSYCPNVAHNGTGSINNEHPTITWQPGQFSLHPGDNGVYSHARWTSPGVGTIDIVAMFAGIDHAGIDHDYGTTTDVHVLLNGVPIPNGDGSVEGFVEGFGDTWPFSTTALNVGMDDRIDFMVGYGSNQNSTCDTTALSATITFVPEPATLLLLGLGGLGLMRKRRA